MKHGTVVKRQRDLPPGPLPLSYPPRVETEMTSPTEIPDWAKPPEDSSSQPTGVRRNRPLPQVTPLNGNS